MGINRYGFNGMEKDDNVKGEGNSYDFGARIYDPRVGRWLSMDAKSKDYPHSSCREIPSRGLGSPYRNVLQKSHSSKKDNLYLKQSIPTSFN
jgi:RHS repeat-associated protein